MAVGLVSNVLSVMSPRSVSLWRSRYRGRVRRDPSAGLFRTHVFPVNEPINTPTSFPSFVRLQPVTFAVDVFIQLDTAIGCVFEIGSDASGIGLCLYNQLIYFGAGTPNGEDTGVTVVSAINFADAVNKKIRIVAACNPNDGNARLWVDGECVGAEQAVDSVFGPDGWSNAGIGQVNGKFGTATNRLPEVGELSESEVISPLSVYANQLPRRFYTPGSVVNGLFFNGPNSGPNGPG